MSYRAAWEYVHELERASGFVLVERVGPGTSGGMRLTADGRRFLDAYERFRTATDAAAERAFRSSFRAFLRRRPAGG
jgi:molybdate transport repressor ModE-like protein